MLHLLRAPLAVFLAGYLAASDYDPAVARCEVLTISVTGEPRPVFTWTPACPVTELSVRLKGPDATVWAIVGTWPRYHILPPVTYGVGPEGTMAITPSDTLFASGTYDVIISRTEFTGLVSSVGQASFRPARP